MVLIMKKAIFIVLCAAPIFCRCNKDIPENADFSPVDYVSTLTGTMSDYSLSAGNTYPATAMPWGMNFWTPQTGKNGDGWIYSYSAHKIRGFKQTHQPSPWINDYGQFSIMPVKDFTLYDEESRASWFSHKSETAKPYYYQVYLADHDINVMPSTKGLQYKSMLNQELSAAILPVTMEEYRIISKTALYSNSTRR